jgi:DNA-binding transcriptional ArsR family regulator
VNTPRIRDRSGTAPELPAILEWGSAYEALLGLSMFTGDERQESYEVGRNWFRRARRLASRRLRDQLATLMGSAGPRWFLLLGLAHESSTPRDVDALLHKASSMAAEDLFAALLGGQFRSLRGGPGRAALERGLQGDLAAAPEIAARSHPGEEQAVRRLIALGPPKARRLILEVLDRWRKEVQPETEGARILQADLAARKREAKRITTSELVQAVTDGLSYEGEPGIDRVLLVPSLVTRPWITITEWGGAKIFCYRADPRFEAHADARGDPDPVLIYRALGDDTRLRLLRELAGGDRRLTELAATLHLSKSTLHQHLGLLRAAGLVHVSIGVDKRYGLRPGRPDLNALLAGWLGE